MTKNNLPELKDASKKPRIVITMDGGIIQSMQSNHPDIDLDVDIVVLDFDSEGADLDECITKEEARKVSDGLVDIDYDFYLVD